MKVLRKRKNCLTVQEKFEILMELEKGVSSIFLARKYNIAKSSITGIKKNKDKIKTAVVNTFTGPAKKKRIQEGEFPKMEKLLYDWFVKQRERNVPINGELLKAKASFFFDQIYKGTRTFHASPGWMQKFKSRYGIRLLKVCGEKLSSQPELIEPFMASLADSIKKMNLDNEQIYNADETGLAWKLLPDKTFVSHHETTAPGRKISKERLTFLACTNATGTHKLKPLIIGRSKKPRSFKKCIIPVEYAHSKSAWMTTTIFLNWFHNSFVRQVTQKIFKEISIRTLQMSFQVKEHLKSKGLPLKALLLLDNAPSHPPRCTYPLMLRP